MGKLYTYRIAKENHVIGEQSTRTRTIDRYRPLEVGGLYMHLGKGFSGAYRVLALISVETFDD